MELKRTSTAQNLLGTDSSRHAQARQKQAEGVVNLGLGANIVLAVVKIIAGIVGHSQALLADGINSTSDVVYFVVVRILVSLSGKPSDEEHPYGHQQFESIAALVVGAFVITTGLAVFWNSINSAFDLFMGNSDKQSISLFVLFVALGTIITKVVLARHAVTVAKNIKSLAISALASDHRNDIYASSGAAVGIIFGILGYPIWDPLAGALVAIIVTKTGVDILRESAAELMDSVPSKKIDAQVRKIAQKVPDVISVDEVHAHRFGPYLVINLTISIEGNLNITRGDAIAHTVEAELCDNIDMLRKVYIHYHAGSLEIS
ncbi:cation diffusion facilitator family transporter [Planctomycetota bacterium]